MIDGSVWSLIGRLVIGGLIILGVYGAIVISLRSKASPETKGVNWNPYQSIAVTIAIYLMSQIAALAVLMLGLLITGQSSADLVARMEDVPLLQFGFILAVDVATILLVRRLLKTRQTPVRAIGVVRPRWMDLPYAGIGFVAYFVTYLVVIAVVQWFFPGFNVTQEQDVGFDTASKGLALVPIFFSLVILPPIVEELLARGVLFSGLRTKLSFIWAAVITSMLFASAHLPGSRDGSLLWVAAIDTFLLSMVLVYVREKRGSLWPAIYIHGLKNLMAFLVLFVGHFRM